jgi:hypothetical protein
MARPNERVLVTTAPKSPKQELHDRQRRYLLTMGIRVVCFVLAIVFVQVGLRWEAAIAVAGSLVLPWVAVIAANAGPKRTVERPALFSRDRRKEIGPGGE